MLSITGPRPGGGRLLMGSNLLIWACAGLTGEPAHKAIEATATALRRTAQSTEADELTREVRVFAFMEGTVRAAPAAKRY